MITAGVYYRILKRVRLKETDTIVYDAWEGINIPIRYYEEYRKKLKIFRPKLPR